jgi:hypothetical protein
LVESSNKIYQREYLLVFYLKHYLSDNNCKEFISSFSKKPL